MKYRTENLKLVGEHFVQLEEIMDLLETFDIEMPEEIIADTTTLKDLGLTKDDINLMEDILNVKLKAKSKIFEIAEAMKEVS